MRTWITGQQFAHWLDPRVVAERERQQELWGMQHTGPEWWATILTEEVGEFAEAILDLRTASESGASKDAIDCLFSHVETELVQCAAVALSALADLNGRYRNADTVFEVAGFPNVPDDVDPARWWERPEEVEPPTAHEVDVCRIVVDTLRSGGSVTCTASDHEAGRYGDGLRNDLGPFESHRVDL